MINRVFAFCIPPTRAVYDVLMSHLLTFKHCYYTYTIHFLIAFSFCVQFVFRRQNRVFATVRVWSCQLFFALKRLHVYTNHYCICLRVWNVHTYSYSTVHILLSLCVDEGWCECEALHVPPYFDTFQLEIYDWLQRVSDLCKYVMVRNNAHSIRIIWRGESSSATKIQTWA